MLIFRGKALLEFKNSHFGMLMVGEFSSFLGDGILGSDFLQATKADISYNQNLLKIDNLHILFLERDERKVGLEKRKIELM